MFPHIMNTDTVILCLKELRIRQIGKCVLIHMAETPLNIRGHQLNEVIHRVPPDCYYFVLYTMF